MLLLLFIASAAQAQERQRNIVFTNIPDFLRLRWNIVLGPGTEEDVIDQTGTIRTGNAIFMISLKDSAVLAADYEEFDVDTVVQYNLPNPESETGYNTFFHLHSSDGEAIFYPGGSFWTVSVRFGRSGPYASYIAITPDEAAELRELGFYERAIETRRRLLVEGYRSLSRGLDP